MTVARLFTTALLLAPSSFAYQHYTRRDIVEGKVETLSEEDQPYILAPKNLGAGDLASIVRRDNGDRVDPEGMLIGMPPKITELFQEYLEKTGLMDIAHDLLYKDPVKVGEDKVYNLEDGSKWSARTSNNWVRDGDMTWIDPANEYTYELILNIWRAGGFDSVLDTLGEKFGADGLWLDGTSFIIVSNFEGYNIHHDSPGAGSKGFNILFPIVIPENGSSRLLVAERKGVKTAQEAVPINFKRDVGVLVGGDTLHGTGNCDYRENKEFRLAIAVYLIDINEENVEEFASDDTAYYPPMGSYDFLLSQAGRHWGGNSSLANDFGRGALGVEDEHDDCAEWIQADKVMCDNNSEARSICLYSCNVFLDDEVYYENLAEMLGWPTEEDES
eukprot:CAMPEP_0198140390 /NCGR_PEP_ID=MMETSP1443-20131203/3546_1 /TAXON_ID=186043 /ORGANISM="Entomoneis sp., Strain CCMP2396" /LENGTH=386 /DNA_ID=CAMNT_0043802785 /DNA_START=85 /DNA_END=1245 /DNA_ORIENTATION=-